MSNNKKRNATRRRLGSTKKRSLKNINWSFRKVLILLLILVLIIGAIKNLSERTVHVPDPPADGITYQVRGVDVSSYQGDIDWDVLSDQGISFAFIKATEGSTHVDSYFHYNWREAKKTHLKIGAYHFMLYSVSGEEQAENFIDNVRGFRGMLPPVVDVEFYGSYLENNPSRAQMDEVLKPLLEALEDEYDVKPIIYTTRDIYIRYISGNYDNPIWIADFSLPDYLPDGKDWMFCQYSHTGKLDGYSGENEYIDLNVFGSTKEDFLDL